jgi:hypothetical protein
MLRRIFEPEGSEVTGGFRIYIMRSLTCCVASFHYFSFGVTKNRRRV